MSKSILTFILFLAISPVAVAGAAPRQQERGGKAAQREVQRTETTKVKDKSRWVHSHSDNGEKRTITVENRVEFNDDYTDVKSVEAGGGFEVSEKQGGVERRFEASPAGGGELKRRYTVNGEERAFDASARSWLATMLDYALRDGMDAGPRAARMLRERGAAAVIEEAARMRSDHAKRLYLNIAAAGQSTDAATLRLAVQQAARIISSDYEASQFLKVVGQHDLSDASLRAAFFEGVGRVGSDYEKRRVLSSLVERHTSNTAVLLEVVRAASAISSDYEKARMLRDVVRLRSTDAGLRAALQDAIRSIGSDYERRRVLAAFSSDEAGENN